MQYKNADSVMAAYSSLDETEQREFDKRYKELLKFRRFAGALVKGIANSNKESKPRPAGRERKG